MNTFIGTAAEFTLSFKKRHAPVPKRRINHKTALEKAIAETRASTIAEAIGHLRSELRGKPTDWQRGYNSAITALEIMRDQQES
jgi:DNA-binding transcriptional regulator YdaS (Cro superfamily)